LNSDCLMHEADCLIQSLD